RFENRICSVARSVNRNADTTKEIFLARENLERHVQGLLSDIYILQATLMSQSRTFSRDQGRQDALKMLSFRARVTVNESETRDGKKIG
ncbi:hypothetical protein BaRGS_00002672, partial [Batillaria attramentaria]